MKEVTAAMAMTLIEIKDLKKQLGITNAHLADISDVPLSTIQKVLGNTTSAPRQKTLRKLEAALLSEYSHSYSHSGIPTSVSSAKEAKEQNLLKEAPAPYHTSTDPGRIHTIQDYYALPADRRAELIDGVFYDMAAPDGVHQDILLILGSMFRDHIRKNKGECKVYVAPRDVQLDPGDDKTIVQPDILIVCDRNKITDRCIIGAPDFIAEILSPSTREKDLHLKAAKYACSGVREYWIIDPEKRIVLVYFFAESRFPACYTFADTIPVEIWTGQLRIDFGEISEEIAWQFA